jgi:hypothetical protein
MAVKTKHDYVVFYEYWLPTSHSYGRARRYHPNEWVSERGLHSRDFELVQTADDPILELIDKLVAEPPSEVTKLRTGRGSLRGELVIAEDWDSSEVNEEIAHEFGLEP